VPGLAKQTSTPPATRVRTRLSAPFIVPLPFARIFRKTRRKINHPQRLSSKGFEGIAGIAAGSGSFFNRAV
jgi:hypothetical protein